MFRSEALIGTKQPDYSGSRLGACAELVRNWPVTSGFVDRYNLGKGFQLPSSPVCVKFNGKHRVVPFDGSVELPGGIRSRPRRFVSGGNMPRWRLTYRLEGGGRTEAGDKEQAPFRIECGRPRQESVGVVGTE